MYCDRCTVIESCTESKTLELVKREGEVKGEKRELEKENSGRFVG
jgi:hypothetical protein